MMQTIVIIDGLELVISAIQAAEITCPDNVLIYSVYGIASCQDIMDSHSKLRHVHWFSGNAGDMQAAIMRRKAENIFGGIIYATLNPDAPHVQRQCRDLASISPDARPRILKLA